MRAENAAVAVSYHILVADGAANQIRQMRFQQV
jgi:hypothetical protein